MVGMRFGRPRHLAKRSYWFTNLYYAVSDIHREIRFNRGNKYTGSGTTHASLSVEASLEYVMRVVNDYRKYGRIARFHGRVAEVGAGDNCGVAMLLRQDGCASVDLPDRFYSTRDSEGQARVYRELWRRFPTLPKLLENPDPFSEDSFEGIQRHYGDAASCERFFHTHRDYDFIVSRSVLEHISEPRDALVSMANALRPQGRLIHKVDLRDHGMYSDHFHELKFLEAPSWLHSRMTRASGRPNRVLIDVYRETLRSLGLAHELLVTRLAGVGEIDPHLPYDEIPACVRKNSLAYVAKVRQKFARAFRNVSDEDISVTGFFLVAQNSSKAQTGDAR